MKVTYYTRLITEEGPGLLFKQIRQALEEAGVLYKYKHIQTEDRVRFDKKAAGNLEKCDLFVCDLWDALSVLREAKKKGIKTLGLCFNTETAYRKQICDNLFTRYGVSIHDPLLHRTLKAEQLVDYFLVPSEFCKHTFVLHGIPQEKVFVVHPGVDAEKFGYAEQNTDFKVLFVGTNPIRKGLPLLLKAWFQLEIKGRLVNRSTLTLPSMGNVISMPQWRTHDDMVGLYHSCSLSILPSLEDAFALTVLESMSCGRPVILTNVSGAAEIIRDYNEGILIPPNNIKAIKDAILYFYENREELVRMGANARKKAEEYPWSRFREGVVGVVKKILENEKT
jgi:glycosyltransferase involved in cell wall biosynthesis